MMSNIFSERPRQELPDGLPFDIGNLPVVEVPPQEQSPHLCTMTRTLAIFGTTKLASDPCIRFTMCFTWVWHVRPRGFETTILGKKHGLSVHKNIQLFSPPSSAVEFQDQRISYILPGATLSLDRVCPSSFERQL